MNTKPVIALDYDGTCTTNIPFWAKFIALADAAGYHVLLVTMRTPEECAHIDPRISSQCDIIPTSRKAKREFLDELDIDPVIWIDDQPDFILMDAQPISAKSSTKE